MNLKNDSWLWESVRIAAKTIEVIDGSKRSGHSTHSSPALADLGNIVYSIRLLTK